MTTEDLKIYLLNASAFLMSFSNIEMLLKIVLLLISIGYTIYKWNDAYKRNKSTKK